MSCELGRAPGSSPSARPHAVAATTTEPGTTLGLRG